MPPIGSTSGGANLTMGGTHARQHFEYNPNQLYSYWVSLVDGLTPQEQQILGNQYSRLYGDYMANVRGGSRITPFADYLSGIDPHSIISEEMSGLSPQQRGATDPRRFAGPARWITF